MFKRLFFVVLFFSFLFFHTPRSAVAALPTIYIPYFNGAVPFDQTAIFGFGKISPSENYTDVRIGSNDTELYLYNAIFDRRIWYDTTPTASDLTNWDAIALYIQTSDGSRYRISSQFGGGGANSASYQLFEKWNGSSYQTISVPLTTSSGWRGDFPNTDVDDRGWALTFHIPFSSLNLSNKPATGTMWKMAVVSFDRDSAAQTSPGVKSWPEAVNLSDPQTWGNISFGIPQYQVPQISNEQTLTVAHKLQNATVIDAHVGGGSLCGEGLDYWNQWGEKNYNGATTTVVQNQSDIADWPCFSKIYLSFPALSIPAGKVIKSATFTIYQSGNSGVDPKKSLIQVSEAMDAWNEATINWNNAPQLSNNTSYAWVDPIGTFPGWPGVPWNWDVSAIIAQHATSGTPIHLAMYTSDGNYHSGKYFVTSETGDWNAAGRPRLTIVYGDPVTGGPSPSPTFQPHQADIDNNSRVNMLDAGFVISSFGKLWSQVGYNDNADINGDGQISGSDLVGLLTQWL